MTVVRSSLVRAAYGEIRKHILSGELEPGSRVTVRPLADELGLSPTPIRAALAALEKEGFLDAREHRGYFIPIIGVADMIEIYELREVVDGIASRRAAAAPDRHALVSALEDVVDAQRRCVAEGDLHTYGELDVTFHRMIWSGSGNRRLLQVADNLLAQLRIANSISARAPGRLPLALDEHAAIVEGLREGDAAVAEGATRTHVKRAGVALQQLLMQPT